MTPTIIALVPARAGSKRVIHKNTRKIAGHPLLAYALATAHEAGIFGAVAVSSDDPETLEIAEQYGASHLILCPLEIAHKDADPDIFWVRHALGQCQGFDAFCILRPTSPFRRGDWVRDAWERFQTEQGAHSLRAMRPVAEHPAKMWRMSNGVATPILPFDGPSAPWHSMPTQELPSMYVQTAALEIAWVETVERLGSISGSYVVPWLTQRVDPESIDINTAGDWVQAEALASACPNWLPKIEVGSVV